MLCILWCNKGKLVTGALPSFWKIKQVKVCNYSPLPLNRMGTDCLPQHYVTLSLPSMTQHLGEKRAWSNMFLGLARNTVAKVWQVLVKPICLPTWDFHSVHVPIRNQFLSLMISKLIELYNAKIRPISKFFLSWTPLGTAVAVCSIPLSLTENKSNLTLKGAASHVQASSLQCCLA